MTRPPHRPRHIAPRLASKQKRVPNAGALPPHVKQALQMIAYARGESCSWVMEQLIYAHFHLRPPAYVGERRADLDLERPAAVKYPKAV
jgi:hypothetical protein